MRHTLSQKSVSNLEAFILDHADRFPNLIDEGEVLLADYNLAAWEQDILETAFAEGWESGKHMYEVATPGHNPTHFNVNYDRDHRSIEIL